MLLDKLTPVLHPLLNTLLPLVEDVFGSMLPVLGDATEIVENDLLAGRHGEDGRGGEKREERQESCR